jgi:hypothetical protein
VAAIVLSFALDDLRAAYRSRATPGVDPRHDGAPFRAFRDALLAALAGAAHSPATLAMWWQGTFNGYSLCVSVDPADAVPGAHAAAAAACPVDDARVAPPSPGGYPLGRVAPGHAEPARDAAGDLWEAPFGAATGHFGAPGMRRVP